MTRFDMSDVRRLAAQLMASEGPVRDAAQKSIKRGAYNVKRGAQQRIGSALRGKYTQHYVRSITFDILDGGLAAEIGPTIGRKQAFLGKILENGTATSGAHPHMMPAADEEEDRIADGMAVAVSRELRQALR